MERMEMQLDYVICRAWNTAKKHGGWVLLFTALTFLLEQLISPTFSMEECRAIINSDNLAQAIFAWLRTADTDTDFTDIINMWKDEIFACIITSPLVIAAYKIQWQSIRNIDTKINISEILKATFSKQYWNFLIIYIIQTSFVLYFMINFSHMFLRLSHEPSFIEILLFLFNMACAIYVFVRIIFIDFIAANDSEKGINDILTHSWNLTKGHFWKLFAYGIVVCQINILGYCCCGVGVVATSVLTTFMLAECYRILNSQMSSDTEYSKSASA